MDLRIDSKFVKFLSHGAPPSPSPSPQLTPTQGLGLSAGTTGLASLPLPSPEPLLPAPGVLCLSEQLSY